MLAMTTGGGFIDDDVMTTGGFVDDNVMTTGGFVDNKAIFSFFFFLFSPNSPSNSCSLVVSLSRRGRKGGETDGGVEIDGGVET